MEKPNRQRLRLRYKKDEFLKYISHRDVLRFILKMIRRAEIPFATSGKFSPKPRITFCPALSLGVLAYNELAEIELLEGVLFTPEDLIGCSKLIVSGSKPRDFLVTLEVVSPHVLPLAKQAVAARYTIVSDNPIDEFEPVLSASELLIETKPGKIKDVKPAIRDFKIDGNQLSIDGYIVGDHTLNIVALSRHLEQNSGINCIDMIRETLLDSGGREI